MNWKSARHRRIFWRKNKRRILITIYLFIFYFLILLMITHLKQNRPTLVTPKASTGVVSLINSKTAGQSGQFKVITPTPYTDEQTLKSLPYGQLVWQTYGHESSYGKNDACKSQGLFNGFGFAQNNFGYQCFSSLQEVATKVSDWFASHLQTMTVKQALCFYNKGKLMEDCNYAEYTLAL